MQKSNEQTLKEVINQLLKAYRLDDRLDEVRLLNSWEKVMGKTITKHTKDIFIKNKKLFIKVDSAALREELSYAKEKIVTMLNEEAGKTVIEGVILS